jgi:cellulose synthase/poly-beta-1,6-N-acetylglucosamine synthase-like glycosyltransferase
MFATTSAFWIGIVLLAWVYIGYPTFLAILVKARPVRLDHDATTRDLDAPELTVAIAVHHEAEQIAERVANVLDQELSGARIREVIIAIDGSRDETGQRVQQLSEREPRVRALSLQRGGQTAAQSAAFDAAEGEIVVLTDAETRFEPGCLAALAEAFQDERVGCATGHLEWRNEQSTATAANEGLYWRYERRIRDLESMAGLMTAVTGAVLAIRRSAYRPVPPTASMDHLLPLFVREQGGLVVYVKSARATDRPISGLREQFNNRTRTATRGIAANLSMIRRLDPVRHPGIALAIWSHKLLRWGTPWFAGLTVIAALVLVAGGFTGYAVVPVLGVASLLAGAAGDVIARRGRRPPPPLALARAVLVVNAAFARAWINVLSGRQIEAWHRAEWQQRA